MEGGKTKEGKLLSLGGDRGGKEADMEGKRRKQWPRKHLEGKWKHKGTIKEAKEAIKGKTKEAKGKNKEARPLIYRDSISHKANIMTPADIFRISMVLLLCLRSSIPF